MAAIFLYSFLAQPELPAFLILFCQLHAVPPNPKSDKMIVAPFPLLTNYEGTCIIELIRYLHKCIK
jgi:hypothetical protein